MGTADPRRNDVLRDAGLRDPGRQVRARTAHRRDRRARAALGLLLLAVVPHAWAASECQIAFERWALLSNAQVRVALQSGSGRGACVPTEAARQELLAGLARARGLCAGSQFLSDQTVQQTTTLLSINESFIASLAVCQTGGADSAAGWVTKSAPTAEKPKPAAPLPAPPKPVVAAPAPKPQKPAAAVPPPTPPCLDVSPAKEEHFSLINRRCRGHTVLAVIETRGPGGETVCRGYAINQSVAVRASQAAPPRINHECVLDQGRCNKDRLGNMFPECDW